MRVIDRSIIELDAHVAAPQFYLVGCKVRAVVGDDAVGNPEAAHETLDELDCGASWDSADGFHFCPLGEFVDGDVEVAVTSRRSREWAQDIQPPNRERPREWNGLQDLSWQVNLLGVELIGFTSLHQLDCIAECCRLIKPTAKRLANEGP